MFPILINLILTPIAYTFKCRFYKQSDSVAMGRQETSTASKIYMQTHEKTVISTVLCSPKVLEQFVDVISVIPKLRYLENILNRNRNLHQNIKFAMEEESNEKLKSVYTLMKRNNRDISVLLKKNPRDTERYTHSSHHQQTGFMESLVSSLFNRGHYH